MNNLEFSFAAAPWEQYLENLENGAQADAVQLLSLLEAEDGDTLEAALQECQERSIFVSIQTLPKLYGFGDTALRLRTEEQWAAKGLTPSQMEPGDPLRIFLEEVAMTPAFGDEQLLSEEAANGDESAMARLVNLSLGKIIQIAGEYTGHGVLLMDLIQEGSLGLMQAVYSPDNRDFTSRSDWWIRFFMARTVVLQAHAEGVGQKVRQDMEDYRNVDEQLLSELSRNATVSEIAQAMHISQEQAENLAGMVAIARKLRQALPEEQEEPEEDPEDQLAVEDTALFQARQRIQELMSGLNETESKIISLRFGLEGGLPLSPEETGRKLGLTPNEVTELEAKAMRKLRKN